MRDIARRRHVAFVVATCLIAVIVSCSKDVRADLGNRWDRDGDSVSTSVEIDSVNFRLYHFDTTRVDANPSIARGTRSSGTLSGGIHLPDAGFGYYHYYGSDALNTDDWGTLALVNTIEGAGRCWTPRTRRSYRPGDMSLMNSGNFLSQHVDHQNGLDVDVRYVRNDGDTSLVLPGDSLKLDLDATILLWNCFLQSPRLAFLIIDSAYFKQRIIPDKTGRLRFDGTPEHANHFHVGIEDPDGTGN